MKKILPIICVLILTASIAYGWPHYGGARSTDPLGYTWDNISTDNITEGSKLFWSQSRFNTAFSGMTTDNLTEGNKLFWSQARFNTAFSGMTSDNLSQGTGNLYFSNSAARAAVSAASPLSYNAATGTVSIPGVTTTPTKGQLLIGNDNGTFGLHTITAGSNITVTNDNNSVTIAATGAASPAWGGITGTLSAQSDLQSAMNSKEPSVSAGSSAQWYNGSKNWFTLYTDNITQGSTNKWYTDAAARAALSGGTGINYNSGTGVITANGGNGAGGFSAYDNVTINANGGLLQVANWLIDDIFLAFFKLSIQASLTIFQMVDGWFDQFENQAGVDTRSVAWTDNATYDSVNHLYKTTVNSSNIAAGTNICNLATIYGTCSNSGTVAATCDNSTAIPGCTNNAFPAYTWWNFGTPQTIQRYAISSREANTYYPTDWVLAGSPDNITYTTLSTVSGISSWPDSTFKTYDIASPAAYQYYRLKITGGQGGISAVTEVNLDSAAVVASYFNMLLSSAPQTATFNPTKARLVLFEQDNTTQTLALNTDLLAYISSDNGTTWQQITLANDGPITTATSTIPAWNVLSGTAAVTGGGNQMRWRIKTANDNATVNHSIFLRGASMTWQ